LLGLLRLKPSHGYALHLTLKAELGELWNISQSQTYNILKRLENQGLVEGDLQARQAAPDRYQLRLTESGRQHFQDWLRQPTNPSSQALRMEFLSRLYFARRLQPEAVNDMVDDQIARIEAGLDQLGRRLDDQDTSNPINHWALEIRLAQIRGFLRWLVENQANIATVQVL
jgi:DNA-binding PadR family transcriptional regulator